MAGIGLYCCLEMERIVFSNSELKGPSQIILIFAA